MNPYQEFVRKIAEQFKTGKRLPLGGFEPAGFEPAKPDAPVGMMFAPHPDDECINGGLPLRLLRREGFRIINVPVTLGSNVKRKKERKDELKAACRYLGFEVEFMSPDGFEKIDPESRSKDLQNWNSAVETTVELLQKFQPKVIFFPHLSDRHPTHCGTNLLISDALQKMPENFSCLTVENEFWQPMESPNLLAELDQEIVGDLVAALSFHTGEVRRNPYHLSLPAWLMDNVRRGSEIIGQTGGNAPDFIFAVLHKISLFKNRRLQPAFEKSQFLSAESDLTQVAGYE